MQLDDAHLARVRDRVSVRVGVRVRLRARVRVRVWVRVKLDQVQNRPMPSLPPRGLTIAFSWSGSGLG